MKKIVITGATGNIGQALLPMLLDKEVSVIAITRSADKITQTDTKLEVVEADLKDKASYMSALAGADIAFLLTDGTPDMETIQHDFIDACQAQSILFVVKQSAMGAAPDAPAKTLQMHHAVEEKLKNSGMAYCIVQPNSFTQNLLAHAQSVKEQGAIYAPLGEGKVSYIDVRDVANVVASILTDDMEKHKNKTYILTGPAAVSMQENAKSISDITNKKVVYYPVSDEEGKNAMLGFGMDEWLADDLVAIARLGAEGKADQTSDAVQEITGTKPRAVKDTLENFQSAFQSTQTKG